MAASSDQIQQIEDALASSSVSGWDVAAAVAVLVIAYPVGHGIGRLVRKTLEKVPNLPDGLAKDAGRFGKWLVYIVATGWALSLLGVSVGWLAMLVAVILVLAVLMLKPMVENSAAGLLLTVRPAFGVGDQIETTGFRGTVGEIGSRSTVLHTSDGRRIHIPNTEVLGAPIVVYTAGDSRKAAFDITVANDTDLDRATARLLKAISNVDGVQKDPAPGVQATGFDGSAVTLSVSYWYPSSMSSDSSVTDGVVRAVQRTLAEAGISFATQTVEFERGVAPPGGTSYSGKASDTSDSGKASEETSASD